MSRKKKYSGLNYWLVARVILSIGLMLFLVFSISKRLNEPVSNVRIVIEKTDARKSLITSEDVQDIFRTDLGYDLRLVELKDLDINRLENLLLENPRVENAELYIDKFNLLNIHITEKKPIVRVDMSASDDYYLDYKGDRIPVTDVFRVPVVTGYLDSYYPGYRKDKSHNLNDILELAQRVYDDEFLTALVEQIHIDKNNEITLVPKLGRDKIILGDANNLDEKFYKLKIYYEKGIKNIGIEKFDELDFKYEGQIVGRHIDS